MIKKILVPEDRVAVLIGKKAEIKNRLEGIGIQMDVHGNEVTIVSDNGLSIMHAENIIKAIARGFSPETAFELIDEEKFLEVMPLDFDRNRLNRIRSRIIGSGGKSRRNIEEMTNTKISIYGKTVSIIGRFENVQICTKAIEKLIQGAPHIIVYGFLEKSKKVNG